MIWPLVDGAANLMTAPDSEVIFSSPTKRVMGSSGKSALFELFWRIGEVQPHFCLRVTPAVELGWSREIIPVLLFILMCFHVREVAGECQIGAVDQNIFKDVSVPAPGWNLLGGRSSTFFNAPRQSV